MRSFLIALQFLTILPIRLHQDVKSDELARSLVYFPVVGLLLGLCLVILEYALTLFLPSSIVILILIFFLIIITGGLHLDGLADTVDALFSGKTGDSALKIMKEATVGPLGVCAIFAVMLAKYLALGEFFGTRLYMMLLLFPMVGRMGIVAACRMFPYARSKGTGKMFIDHAGLREFVIAGLLSFTAGFFLYGLRALFILACVMFIVVFSGKYFIKRFGGITGDTLGFINEIGELVAILGGTVLL